MESLLLESVRPLHGCCESKGCVFSSTNILFYILIIQPGAKIGPLIPLVSQCVCV